MENCDPIIRFILYVMGMTFGACCNFGFWWTANYAEKHKQDQKWARVLLRIFYCLIAVIHILCAVGIVVASSIYLENNNIDISQVDGYPFILIPFVLFFALGLLLLLKPCRSVLERLMPINKASNLQAFALSFSMLLFILFTAYGVLIQNGIVDFDDILLEEFKNLANLGWLDVGFTLFTIVYGNIVIRCLSVILAVGYLSRRNWRGVMERLGLTSLNRERITRGVIWGLLLAVVVSVLEFNVGSTGEEDRIRQFLNGIDPTLVSSVYAKLMLNILVISLAAGVGEEIIFRGALQPRFGSIYTSILFALLHVQYISHPLGLVVIFGLSILFGKMRQKYDTTTAIVIHTVYDIVIFTLAIFYPFY